MQHLKIRRIIQGAILAIVVSAQNAFAQMPTTVTTDNDPFEQGTNFMQWIFEGITALAALGAGIVLVASIVAWWAGKQFWGVAGKVIGGLIAISGISFIISKAVGG